MDLKDKLNIAVVYTRKYDDAKEATGTLVDEFDDPSVAYAIADALKVEGWSASIVEADQDLGTRLVEGRYNIVFNTAEGIRGTENESGYMREAAAPYLFERLSLPYSGTKAGELEHLLTKGGVSQKLRKQGISAPLSYVFAGLPNRLPSELIEMINLNGVFLKPDDGGSSMGVDDDAHCKTLDHFEAKLLELIPRYGKVAVQQYIPGKEYTIGIVESLENPVMKIAEITFPHGSSYISTSVKWHDDDPAHGKKILTFPDLDDPFRQRLEDYAMSVFRGVNASGHARMDIRYDPKIDNFYVVDINFLPGLNPVDSWMVRIGEATGKTYPQLIGAIFQSTLNEYRLK
ncbi:MAG: hypothetical protein NDI94_04450 [Candidatus Woesearchaeota archaeon]|nr:hypothetical protein [Candidatus Woesearchaeota archaeon]